MKLFFFKVSCLVLPVFFLVFLVNISKDPGQVFVNRHIEITDIIIKGQNVKTLSAPSEWGKLHEAFITERKYRKLKPFDIVTFGSSRSCEIGKVFFKPYSYHNCVVTGGNVLDYISLYNIFNRNDQLPKIVLINIDSWALYNWKSVQKGKYTFMANGGSEILVKESLMEHLEPGIKDIGITMKNSYIPKLSSKERIMKFIDFFSPSYFQSSINVIFDRPVDITDEDYIKGSFVLRDDGSYSLYRPNESDAGKIADRARQYAEVVKGNFYCDTCVNGSNMMVLKSFISKLQSKGISVILFLSPVHPALYDVAEKYEKNLLEKELRDFSANKNILLLGSYNPYVYSLKSNETDFLDEYHLTDQGAAKVFEYHHRDLELFIKKAL
jgi:hypothetical protein